MSSGVPNRIFNMQLIPNFPGPLDARSIGRGASDRPTINLYDGLLRYEDAAGVFVYARYVNGEWTWRTLGIVDSVTSPITFSNSVAFLNNIATTMTISSNTVAVSGTLNATGNTTLSGVTVSGNAIVNGTLTVGGKAITGNTDASDITYGTSNVKATLDTLASKVTTLESQVAALQKRTTVLHGINLPSLSNFKTPQGTQGQYLEWTFVHNPNNHTLFQDRVQLPAGTYRFVFYAQSFSTGVGLNDACICSLFLQNPSNPFDKEVLFGYGYNEWNGGGVTVHHAPVIIDRTFSRSAGVEVGCNLIALDGQLLRTTLTIERLA